MFGREDDVQPTNDNQVGFPPADAAAPAMPDPNLGQALPAPAASPAPWQHPGAPIDAPADVAPAASVVTPVSPAGPVDTNDLLDIKQQALSQLSPLVGHLDQSPEEKFRTTMMMIQASDDQSLVRAAYDAAQAITDEKARAQALLDIVNEINYFTQHTAN